MVEVIDAKNNRKKNDAAQMFPPVVWEKIKGNTSKTNFGPAVGSRSNDFNFESYSRLIILSKLQERVC